MSEDYKDPGEAVYEGLDSMLALVHTNSVGEIVSFDRATQTCTVQPSLKVRREGVDAAEALSPIEDAPVIFFGSGNFWMTVDLIPGSNVAMIVGERSIANWLNAGGIVDPELRHKFRLTDAIVLAGLNSIPGKLTPGVTANCMEIRNRLLTVFARYENAKIAMGAPVIEINGDADFAVAFDDLKAGFDTLVSDFNALLTDYIAHVHPIGSPTTGPPVPPVPPLVVPSVASVDASKVSTVTLP